MGLCTNHPEVKATFCKTKYMTTGTIVLILQSVVAMSTIVVNTKLNKLSNLAKGQP